MQFLIDQLLAKRYSLALIMLILGSAITWGMQHTSLDATFNSILSEDDPYREEVEQARRDFPPSTSVLFAFQASPDVFNFESLHAMDDLTNRYIEIESAISVGSLLNRRLDAVDADRYDRDYLIPDLSRLTQEDLIVNGYSVLNDGQRHITFR